MMQLIHNHPGREIKAGLNEGHVIIDTEQLHKAKKMEQAMLLFIKRVDIGEVRSKKTYQSFKDILGV